MAAIMALIPLPEVLKLGGLSGATRIRWLLFGVACANAVSDLALDAFALRQVPEEWQHLPAVCQIVGIFVGKTAAKSRAFLVSQQRSRINMSLTSSVCWRFWVFSYRPQHASLGYQLIMPAMYFHAGVVLPSRYEQFGFQGEDYAAYDLPLAVITVTVLVFASRAAEDAGAILDVVWYSQCQLKTFLLCYAKHRIFVALCLRDGGVCFLWSFVASLDQSLVATLVTMQASAFNFSEFFHWLAPALVDHFSVCSKGQDEKFSRSCDAYPMVAAGLTLVSLLFLSSQWNKISAYQDVSSPGWNEQNPLLRHKLMVGMILVCICVFTWIEVMQ